MNTHHRKAPTMTTTTAPTYVARDTHQGKWQTTNQRGARRTGTFTAAELGQYAREDGFVIVWEFSGHTRSGRELFTRSRYLPTADGRLYGYDSEGAHKVTHPAARALRVATG